MKPSTARGLALSAVAGSAIIAGAAHVKRTGEPPRLRIAIGAAVAGVALVALAGPLPGIAGGLAVVLILTTFLTTGYDLLEPLTRLTRS